MKKEYKSEHKSRQKNKIPTKIMKIPEHHVNEVGVI